MSEILYTDITQKPGSLFTNPLTLIKPEDGLHLVVKYAPVGGTLATAVTVIDTKNNSGDRVKVKCFLSTGSGGYFVTCPASGFGTPYDGAVCTVDLSGITGNDNVSIFYSWYNSDSELSDYKATVFPNFGAL